MSFWRSNKPSIVDELPVIQPPTLPTEYVERTAQDVLFGSGNYFNNLGNKRLAEIISNHSTDYYSSKKNQKKNHVVKAIVDFKVRYPQANFLVKLNQVGNQNDEKEKWIVINDNSDVLVSKVQQMFRNCRKDYDEAIKQMAPTNLVHHRPTEDVVFSNASTSQRYTDPLTTATMTAPSIGFPFASLQPVSGSHHNSLLSEYVIIERKELLGILDYCRHIQVYWKWRQSATVMLFER